MTPARFVLGAVLLAILLGLAGLFLSLLWMPGKSYDGQFKPLDEQEKKSEARLREDVQVLAGAIGKRYTPENLDQAVEYIESVLLQSGYKTSEQDYAVEKQQFKNIEAELKGESSDLVIVCAHYDSVVGTAGANDNGSGVAATLEIARLLSGKCPKKTIRFVLFGTEEPPFFRSTNMGSYHYAMRCKERGEKIEALLDMETLGYYSDEPDSQRYPSNFVPGYPTKGNFITFVGNSNSKSLVEKCIGVFRQTTPFPSEGVAAPEWVTGVDWADQYWFWKLNYPGVMITDTAPYRYPYYHDVKDTPDKLTYPKFARVVYGLSKVVAALSM
ncbi:MAG: M28 family peptidase [Candidatus Obscuribacterales bacterium]|nr:M28 family peptidase [Candidatus Obscuribacterales bacterium]